MSEDRGGCLNTIGQIVGILAGLVTVVTFLSSNGDSLLETFSGFLPITEDLFSSIEDAVVVFADSWPLGPWLSALLVFLVIGVLRYLAEVTFDLWTIDVEFSGVAVQALIFLPLALLWVWTFSGVASGLGMAAFFAGYLVSIILSILVASEFGW